MLDLSDYAEEGQTKRLTNVEIYDKFLKIIIPKIIILFNLVKKYIKGKLSMVDLVTYMEPFLIYTSDLTYVNYKEMSQFIQEKIKEYNSNYVKYSREFSVLKQLKTEYNPLNPLTNMWENVYNIKIKVFSAYMLPSSFQINSPNTFKTTSETLKKIITSDYGNLFNTSVIFSNLALMYPNELNPVFDLDKDKLKKRLEASRENNKCSSHVIAKKYISIEKLQADNDKVIYFDRDYDTTDYDIIDKKFKEERKHLDDTELELFITEEFKKKDKLDEFTAAYMAETLVNRAKKVIDGQYAIIKKDPVEPDPSQITKSELEYYIRDENRWIFDSTVDPKMFVQDSDILCNIQTDCLFNANNGNDGTCESVETVKTNAIDNALKEIMTQFDNKYNISKAELSDKLLNISIITRMLLQNYN